MKKNKTTRSRETITSISNKVASIQSNFDFDVSSKWTIGKSFNNWWKVSPKFRDFFLNQLVPDYSKNKENIQWKDLKAEIKAKIENSFSLIAMVVRAEIDNNSKNYIELVLDDKGQITYKHLIPFNIETSENILEIFNNEDNETKLFHDTYSDTFKSLKQIVKKFTSDVNQENFKLYYSWLKSIIFDLSKRKLIGKDVLMLENHHNLSNISSKKTDLFYTLFYIMVWLGKYYNLPHCRFIDLRHFIYNFDNPRYKEMDEHKEEIKKLTNPDVLVIYHMNLFSTASSYIGKYNHFFLKDWMNILNARFKNSKKSTILNVVFEHQNEIKTHNPETALSAAQLKKLINATDNSSNFSISKKWSTSTYSMFHWILNYFYALSATNDNYNLINFLPNFST